jgi:hypothetical protein
MPRVSVSRVDLGRSQMLTATSQAYLRLNKIKVLLPFHSFFNQGVPFVVLIFEFSLDRPTDEVRCLKAPDAKFDLGSLFRLEFVRRTRLIR